MAAFAWLLIAAAVHAQSPELLSLVPTSGPVEGGTRLTVTGAGLSGGFDLICRFGQGQRSQVPGTFEGLSSHGRVYCSAPAAHAGYETLVQLSLDGGGSYVGKQFKFTYFHEATVSAVSPNSGPAAGATLVRVSGYNFAPTAGLSCLFGWRLAAATYVDFQTVTCAAPQHAANSSVRFSFEDAALGMELEDAEVGASAALAGEAAAAEGVLWMGAVPAGAARGYAGAGSEAAHEVRAGCGLLALLQPAGTSAAAQGFSAQFALLMRGEAIGLTFSYGGGGEAGELWEGGRTGWGVEGVASGLAVRFWGETSTHFRPYSIEVVLHGELLERAVLGRRLLLSGAWAEISLRLDPISHELSVSYDGTEHLTTTLAGFAPAASDRFFLSGCAPPRLNASAATSTGVLLDDLVIAASSFMSTRTEQLHVSLNGDSPSPSASASSAAYTFHAPPRLAALSPSCGPAEGGTRVQLTGLHFGTGADTRCRFGERHVPAAHAAAAAAAAAGPPEMAAARGWHVGRYGATHVAASRVAAAGGVALRCLTPRLWAGEVPTEVTLNGQDHTYSGLSFFSHPELRLSRISPTLAPEAGGTLLALHGPGLGGGCDYRCRFGGNQSAEVAATYNGLTRAVECFSPSLPPLPRGENAVQLSLNGQSFTPPTAAASLLVHATMRVAAVRTAASAARALEAAQGPRRGGTVLLLQGSGFGGFSGQGGSGYPGLGGRGGRVDDGGAQCVVGAARLAATIVDDQTVRCAATPAAEEAGAAAAFDAALDGGAVPSRLVLGGVAAAVAESWAGAGGALGGYLRLTAAEAAGAGGALVLWPALENTSGCEPPLGGCRYLVRGSARGEARLSVLRVSFRLRLGTAIGLSLSYGALEDYSAGEAAAGQGALANETAAAEAVAARLGEWGGGDGLRLRWHVDGSAAAATAAADATLEAYKRGFGIEEAEAAEAEAAAAAAAGRLTFSVEYQHEPVLSVVAPAAVHASSGSFVAVSVQYGSGGLSVTHGGETLVASHPIPGWDPRPGWRLGIGARAPSRLDGADLRAADGECALRDLSVRGGAAFQAQPVDVSLTLNNQDLVSPSPARYGFVYTSPHVTAIVPPSGPADGGLVLTVQGSGFDGGWAYACRFGADILVAANLSADASELYCLSPERPGTDMFAVEATLDGEAFTADGVTYLSMRPAIASFVPASSPAAGGSAVSLLGAHFGNGIGHQYRHRCRFGDATVVGSYVASSGAIVCVSPNATTAGEVPLFVSLDAVTFFTTPAATFTYSGGEDPAQAAILAALLSSLSSTPPLPPAAPADGPQYPPHPSMPPPDAEEARLQALGLPRALDISPSSGEVSGGTPVTVTGSRLTGGDGYLCRFGASDLGPWRPARSNQVPATLSESGSQIFCSATPAALAGARVALWRAFREDELADALGGMASVANGTLQLTNGTADEASIGHVRFAPTRPLQAFVARFLLRVTPGGAGGSLSFHYGPPPHLTPHYATPPPHFTPPQDAHGAGLQVTLDATVAAHAVEVRLDGAVVWRGSLPSGALHAAGDERVDVVTGVAPLPVAVRLEADTAGGVPLLSVTHGDLAYVEAMPLPGMRGRPGGAAAAEASWQFGFVARSGAAALVAARASSAVAAAAVGADGVHALRTGADVTGDAHGVSAFEVEDLAADAAPHLAHLPFAITINAQQFSADPREWTYLAPPTLTTVFPQGGSSAGGTTVTISGAYLSGAGSHLLCSFGLLGDNSTGVHAAPPTALGTGATPGGREWAARPDVSDATHHAGSAPRIPRRAHEERAGTAAEEGGEEGEGAGFLTCDTPPLSAAMLNVTEGGYVAEGGAVMAALRVSLNGQQFSTPLPFTYFGQQPSVTLLSPSCGPAAGSTLVALSGAQLGNGTAYRCKFGHGSSGVAATVLASYRAGEGMRCVSPALAPRVHTLEVSLNAQDYTRSGQAYEVYPHAAVTRLDPRSGPSAGGTTTQASRSAGRGCDHRCRFGGALVVAAWWATENASECATPPLAAVVNASRALGVAPAAEPAADPATDEDAAGPRSVEVSLNAQQYSTDALPFDYFAQRVSHLDPAHGPTAGGTAVVLHGLRFSSRAEAVLCAFGDAVVNATLSSTTTAWCRAPPYDEISAGAPGGGGGSGGGAVALELSLNGREFSTDGVQYAYAPLPLISAISPMLGPALGATRVTVSAAGLRGGAGALLCRFERDGARHDVAATLQAAGSSVRCHAPPLHTLLTKLDATATYATDFGSLPSGSVLHGGARLEGGHLRLTETRRAQNAEETLRRLEEAGEEAAAPGRADEMAADAEARRRGARSLAAWSVEPPPGRSELLAPRVAMMLLLDGRAEHGLCLSYAPPRAAASSSSASPRTAAASASGCTGGGLHVLVHSSVARCEATPNATAALRGDDTCARRGMRVRLDGVLLRTIELGRQLADAAWAPFSLSVHPPARAAEAWRGRGARPEAGGAQLELSYAGEAWRVALGDNTSWAPQAGWSVVLSAWRGEDAPGEHSALCWVDDFALRDAALLPRASAALSVVTNPHSARNPEGVFVSEPVAWEVYAPPAVHTLTPASGPAADAPLVLVDAHGLGADRSLFGDSSRKDTRCRFGDHVVPASYSASPNRPASPGSAHLLCHAPRLLDLAEAVLAPVHIALNGQQFTDAGFFGQGARLFALHPPIALAAVSPAAGPEAGGTRVRISGTQLSHGARTQYRCRFGDWSGPSVPATLEPGGGALRCTSPAQPALLAAAIASNAGVFVGQRCSQHRNLSAAVVLPWRWPLGTSVSEFNATHVTLCAPVPREAPRADVPLAVTLNDQDYSAPPLLFRYVPHTSVAALVPASGPAVAGREVTIRGDNFNAEVAHACRFGIVDVGATRIHSGEIRCTSPLASAAGVADEVEVNFSDPLLLSRGAAVTNVVSPTAPAVVVEVPETYVPPPLMALSSFRIDEEPSPRGYAGAPFGGAFVVQLLDQEGGAFPEDGRKVSVQLRTENCLLAGHGDVDTELVVANTSAPCADANPGVLHMLPEGVPPDGVSRWCAQGKWCPSAAARLEGSLAVGMTAGGVVRFGGLLLNTLGGKVYFEVRVEGLEAQPQRSAATYEVLLGPPTQLRFLSEPPRDNLQDAYFETMPALEVTDLGGNRIAGGKSYIISLELHQGEGRLRGPRVRWSRRGVARFERLRIKAPGYDKQLSASAAGLATGYSGVFGVVPHGIPHALRWVEQPPAAVLSGASFVSLTNGTRPAVIGLFDVYGELVSRPPAEALAPYVGEGSPRRLEDVCDSLCRAHAYPLTLSATPRADENPHLHTSFEGVEALIAVEQGDAVTSSGLASFRRAQLTLGERSVSTGVVVHVGVLASATEADPSYRPLVPATSEPVALMRAIDRYALKLCDSGRDRSGGWPLTGGAQYDADGGTPEGFTSQHNAGECSPYPGAEQLGSTLFGYAFAGETFSGPLVTVVGLLGDELVMVDDAAGVPGNRGEGDAEGLEVLLTLKPLNDCRGMDRLGEGEHEMLGVDEEATTSFVAKRVRSGCPETLPELIGVDRPGEGTALRSEILCSPPDPTLTAVLAAATSICRHVTDYNSPTRGQPDAWTIRVSGVYAIEASSLGLASGTSRRSLTVLGGPPHALVFAYLPSEPQPYAHHQSGRSELRQRLAVRLLDRYGNHNTTSGAEVELELPGENALFLEGGWLTRKVSRRTVEGVADFTDAVIVPPLSFHEPGSVLQAVHVCKDDNYDSSRNAQCTPFGPEQGGWGIERDILFSQQGQEVGVVVTLKGVKLDEGVVWGEVVLMPSHIAMEDPETPCAKAGDVLMQSGDYAYPPDENKPALRPKYLFRLGSVERDGGWFGNFTIREPPPVMSYELKRRVQADWYPDGATPLEEDVYTVCINTNPEASNEFTAQLGRQFVVGPSEGRRVLSISPAAIYPGLETEITLLPGPLRGGGVSLQPGDRVAFRSPVRFEERNCSSVLEWESLEVSENMTVRFGGPEHYENLLRIEHWRAGSWDGPGAFDPVTGITGPPTYQPPKLPTLESRYILCVANSSRDLSRPWQKQDLPRLVVTWERNTGFVWPTLDTGATADTSQPAYYSNPSPYPIQGLAGWIDGVFHGQRIAMQAHTSLAGVASARVEGTALGGAMVLEPPGLPVALRVSGPTAGSCDQCRSPGAAVVRGLPFEAQPEVRVVDVAGVVHEGVDGEVQVSALGGCNPKLQPQAATKSLLGSTNPVANFHKGVARFSQLEIPDEACLNEEVTLKFTVTPSKGIGVRPDPLLQPTAGPLPPPEPAAEWSAGRLGLEALSLEPFVVGVGAAHRVELQKNLLTGKSISLLPRDADPDATCMQTFEEGFATLSAVVRDAQGSRVSDFNRPVDLRLCEASPVPGGEPRCPSPTAALTGEVQAMPTNGRVTFKNFSVTNISYHHVLVVFANMLATDATEAFSACDAGVAQVLAFFQQPQLTPLDGFGSAALPFAVQPILVVYDGFGRLLPAGASSEFEVSLAVVSAHLEPGGAEGPQLSGATTITSALTNPLGLNVSADGVSPWGQHAVFSGLSLGTAGTYVLEARTPAVAQVVRSDPLTVTPSRPTAMRFTRLDHGHAAPGSARATVGEPVAPGYVLQMLDAGGNNVTHEMANATVRLRLPPPEDAASILRRMPGEGGAAEGVDAAGPDSRGPLNGGGMFGELTVTALNGTARLENVSFDEARSRKLVVATATLDGRSLGNATSGPLRVMPGAPAQMRFTLEPRAMYAPAELPPTPVKAGIGFYQPTWKDALAKLPPAAPHEAIDVEVAIFDRFGNHACNALMAEEECAYTDLGWEIALSLVHTDFVNYTYDERTAEWDLTTTLHAYRDTRTVSSQVVFEDGSLKASFRGLRIYREGVGFRFNASLLALGAPGIFALTPEGLPRPESLLPYVTSSAIDTMPRGVPVALVFSGQPPPITMAEIAWSSYNDTQLAVEIHDIYGDPCPNDGNRSSMGERLVHGNASDFLRVETINATGDVVSIFAGWDGDGTLTLETTSGNASLGVLIPESAALGLRLRASLLGAESRVPAALTQPFDVFGRGLPYLLRFVTQPAPFVLSGGSFDRVPRVALFDVSGAAVQADPVTGLSGVTVQLDLEIIAPPQAEAGGALEGAELIGAHHAPSVFGIASFHARAGLAGLGVAEGACAAIAEGGRCIARLRASAVSGGWPLLSAHSEAFEIVGRGTAVKLAFARPATAEGAAEGAAGEGGGAAEWVADTEEEGYAVVAEVVQLDAPLPSEVVVHIVDPLGDRVSTPTTRVHVCLLGGSGGEPACAPGAPHHLGSAVAWRGLPGGEARLRPRVTPEALAAVDSGGEGLSLLAVVLPSDFASVLQPARTSRTFNALSPGVPVRLAFAADALGAAGRASTAGGAAAMLPPLQASAVLPWSPVVHAVDVLGEQVPALSGPVSLVVVQPPPLEGVNVSTVALVGNLTARMVNGVATFDGLRLELSGAPRAAFSMLAHGAGVRNATSASFEAIAHGEPYALRVTQQPSAFVAAGSPLPTALQVQLVDLAGQIARAERLISIALAPPPADPGGEAGGDASQAAAVHPIGSVMSGAGGNASFASAIDTAGTHVLVASAPHVTAATSRTLLVLPAPARLPCDPPTCQWASGARSGEGRLLPSTTPAELLALGAGGGGAAGGAGGAEGGQGDERPELATGPPDMVGCAVRNEGRVWEPRDGRARWLLVGFAAPQYTRGVAVYESAAYGAVTRLVLLDERGGAHLVLDSARGDEDDADCVHAPLLRTFAPTRVRIAAAWLLVGGDSQRRGEDAPHEGARLAQIDAVQLLGASALVAAHAVPLRAAAATRGAAELARGELRLTAAEGGQSGAFTLHMPRAYVPHASEAGGGVSLHAAAQLQVSFDLHMGAGAGDGVSVCYGELPAHGAIGEAGVGHGLCLGFATAEGGEGGEGGKGGEGSKGGKGGEGGEGGAGGALLVEARFAGALLTARTAPTPNRTAHAAAPECDAGPPPCVATYDANGIATAYSCPAALPLRAECEAAAAPPPTPLQMAAAAAGRQPGSQTYLSSQSLGGGGADAAGWRRVVVQVAAQGLSLWVDGLPLFERAPLPAWEPRPSWGLGFGARTGMRAAAHRIGRLKVERGGALESAHVPLYLTLNGQQFVAVGGFDYHAPPAVSRVTPSNGPTAGGTPLTLHGSALGGADRYLCRFALGTDPPIETEGAFVPDDGSGVSGVHCLSPSREQMTHLARDWSPERQAQYVPLPGNRTRLELRLRLWRDAYEYPPRAISLFEMTPPLAITALRPASGPIHGGTVLHAEGGELRGEAALWHAYTCRFSAAAAAGVGGAPASALPHDCSYGAPQHCGEGGVVVAREVAAAYVASPAAALRCTSPVSPAVVRSALHQKYDTYAPLDARLDISLNGAQFEPAAPFAFYDPPGGLVLIPSLGPDLGGTEVRISGANLTRGTDNRCRFTPHLSGFVMEETRAAALKARREVAATLMQGHGAAAWLRCVTPPLPPHAGNVTLEVSLNGQQFSAEGKLFGVTSFESTPAWYVPRSYELAEELGEELG